MNSNCKCMGHIRDQDHFFYFPGTLFISSCFSQFFRASRYRVALGVPEILGWVQCGRERLLTPAVGVVILQRLVFSGMDSPDSQELTIWLREGGNNEGYSVWQAEQAGSSRYPDLAAKLTSVHSTDVRWPSCPFSSGQRGESGTGAPTHQ